MSGSPRRHSQYGFGEPTVVGRSLGPAGSAAIVRIYSSTAHRSGAHRTGETDACRADGGRSAASDPGPVWIFPAIPLMSGTAWAVTVTWRVTSLLPLVAGSRVAKAGPRLSETQDAAGRR